MAVLHFRELVAWQRAMDLVVAVYSLTARFPADERFGLTNQMRRAAVSASSNIAEGSSRTSLAEFSRFIEIASGSIYELVSQAFVSKAQGFLQEKDFQALYAACEQLSKMLSGLRTYLLANRSPQ